MIQQKQLEKFKQLPYRERVGNNRIIKSWYEENFQKSANEYYGLGKIYFVNCGNKHVGKPVQQLMYKLKSNLNYIKNKSFKKAVDDLIYSDLLTNIHNPKCTGNYRNRNDWFYVDEKGLVQDFTKLKCSKYYYYNFYLRNHEYFKELFPQYLSIAQDLYSLHLLKDTNEVLEYYHSTFRYIIRYNGLHYYIINEDLDPYDIRFKYVPRLSATHKVVINNALNILQLLKLSVTDLKYHGLIDIKENISNIVNINY